MHDAEARYNCHRSSAEKVPLEFVQGGRRGKRRCIEHKLLVYGTLMVKMGLSYVKTYFLPVDGTFHFGVCAQQGCLF